MDRESVNRAFETTLAEGARLQRSLRYCGFAIENRKKGTASLIDKRKPVFRNRELDCPGGGPAL